jgi:hypothetical protein
MGPPARGWSHFTRCGHTTGRNDPTRDETEAPNGLTSRSEIPLLPALTAIT